MLSLLTIKRALAGSAYVSGSVTEHYISFLISLNLNIISYLCRQLGFLLSRRQQIVNIGTLSVFIR